MPMKLARIVASSVSGRFMYTQIAIKQTSTAPITMASPMLFPMTLRSGLVVVVIVAFASAIKSSPEKEQPGTQRNQNPETKIDERQGAKVRFDSRSDKDPAQYQHAEHSDSDTQHPRREK